MKSRDTNKLQSQSFYHSGTLVEKKSHLGLDKCWTNTDFLLNTSLSYAVNEKKKHIKPVLIFHLHT